MAEARHDDIDRIINVGETERLLSLVGGGLLAAMGMRRASLGGMMMALAGGALAARGLTGYCPMYGMMQRPSSDDRAAIPDEDVEPGVHPFSRHPGDIYQDADKKERVDEASQESFPASDPPSFTPGAV